MPQRVAKDLEVVKFKGVHLCLIVATLAKFIHIRVVFGAGKTMSADVVECVFRITAEAPEVRNHGAIDNLLLTIARYLRHPHSFFDLRCQRFDSSHC